MPHSGRHGRAECEVDHFRTTIGRGAAVTERQRLVDSGQWTAGKKGTRDQGVGTKKQTADSRQQTADSEDVSSVMCYAKKGTRDQGVGTGRCAAVVSDQ
ncbi:MAG TPA: hypothetical protein VMM54_02520 [Nitrospirota bacterium]|nr:hypothetical protein [Nitrospirota bacterium]